MKEIAWLSVKKKEHKIPALSETARKVVRLEKRKLD
jgi:hypothetical protein